MENTELIKAIRGNEECNNCALWMHGECNERKMSLAAADVLEADEQRISELEAQNELKDGTITAMATDIGKLRAQIPKWISVENHLPEESGEYIVYIQMGTGVEVPDFFGSNDLSYVTSMYFKERQKLWLDEDDDAYNADLSLVDTVNDYHVTHWMPLPQNPKGEHE